MNFLKTLTICICINFIFFCINQSSVNELRSNCKIDTATQSGINDILCTHIDRLNKFLY